MKLLLQLFAVLLLSAASAQCADPAAKQFLRYIYGADGIEITNICHACDDVWMLKGPKDSNALAEIESLKWNSKSTEIISGVLRRRDIYFIEMRDGKVDPAFNLDGIYILQRRLILQFLLASLCRDEAMLKQMVTDPDKLKIVGPKAARGDMDVYEDMMPAIPVVRTSKPGDDAKTKSITYRLPLGDAGLSLTIVMKDGRPKIDTSKTLQVPLEFFFRER